MPAAASDGVAACIPIAGHDGRGVPIPVSAHDRVGVSIPAAADGRAAVCIAASGAAAARVRATSRIDVGVCIRIRVGVRIRVGAVRAHLTLSRSTRLNASIRVHPSAERRAWNAYGLLLREADTFRCQDEQRRRTRQKNSPHVITVPAP